MDQRLIDRHVDLELSLGDFVLSGGEIPAMALMDAIVRQLPGALNDREFGCRGLVRVRPAGLSALHAAGNVGRRSCT
jgi:hypothetical protein